MLIKATRLANGFHVERADADPLTALADGDALPTSGPVIVSLNRFTAEKDALLTRGLPLGLRLESGESPEGLGNAIHTFAVIVLHIPYFKDGRAFSTARLLRTRLGYRGDIRITGHFLKDQIAFFVRVGVNVFDCRENISTGEVEHALTEIGNVYQPSVDGRPTIRDLRAARH